MSGQPDADRLPTRFTVDWAKKRFAQSGQFQWGTVRIG